MKKERAGLRVKLLGGFETRLATGAPVTLATRKAQALLAYLAVRPGQAHPRDKLATLLWADRGEAQARDSLRHSLVDLRKVFPARSPNLTGEARTIALDPAAVDVDVVRFEALAKAAKADDLAQAVEIYQGDFLEGFVLREPAFEEWLVAERERLREVALGALGRLLEQQTRAAASEAAIRTALRLLTFDATQEIAHRALMRLYMQQGRRAAALRQYQTCVGVLQRELGTEPEGETRQLYQEIVQRREEPARTHPSSPKAPAEPAPPPQSATRSETVSLETPVIGRDVELQTLRNALDEARWGRGRVVTILGEAGIGKSRLVAELARSAAEQTARVLLGRSYESEQILPFGPWVDALREAQVMPQDPALLALEPAWRAELTRLFPEIAAEGLPASSDDVRRLFESIGRLIAALSANQPVLLVLEDLHWADEMTVRLLAFLGRRIAHQRVLMVATAREEDLSEAEALRHSLVELRGERHSSELVLSPLSRVDTTRLVESLTSVESAPQAVVRLTEQAWATSEGNPFVVVETLRALREGMTLEVAPSLTVPQRVREVIARRLERVSERSRELLSVAAVIGREFDFALLRRASGLADRDAAASVEELVRRRMLHGLGGGFDFTHDRIREVVYGALLPPRRKLLHGDVAAALEALTVGALDPPAAALGMHYRHAEIWEKAVLYLRQAGLQAAARFALSDARAWLDQALESLAQLPESRSVLEQAVDIRLELRPVLYQLGEGRLGAECLREAEKVAETLNDDHRRGRVAAFLTNSHTLLGQYDDARAAGIRALGIAQRLGDLKLRLVTTTYLEQAHYYRGEFEEAVTLVTENLAALPVGWVYESLGNQAPVSVYDRYWLVRSLAQLGRFSEAVEHEAEAIRLAEPTHHPYTVALASLAGSMLRVFKGDWATARLLAERSLAVQRSGNVRILLYATLGSSAWAMAQLGEADEALDRVREGEEILESARRTVGRSPNRGRAYYSLGRSCLVLGRLDDARRLCDRAIEVAPPAYIPHAWHLLGDIVTHPDRFSAEHGEAHYRKALELAEPRGMRPLVAHCHLGLGNLYRRIGKRDEAQAHLRQASSLYRAMEMAFWLEAAETALR